MDKEKQQEIINKVKTQIESLKELAENYPIPWEAICELLGIKNNVDSIDAQHTRHLMRTDRIEQLRRNIENCLTSYKTLKDSGYAEKDEKIYGILGNLQYYIQALQEETASMLMLGDGETEPAKIPKRKEESSGRRLMKTYNIPRKGFDKKSLSDLFRDIESARVNVEYLEIHPDSFDSIVSYLTNDDDVPDCRVHLGYFWGARVILDPRCPENKIKVISAELQKEIN